MDGAEQPFTSRRWEPPPDDGGFSSRWDEDGRGGGVKPEAALIWHGDVPPEPPPMLVRDLLPRGQLAFIAGVYSSGKTFVAVDLVVCIMLAVAFAGREILRPGGCLWLAAEGANEVDARVTAAARAKCGEKDPPKLPFARQAFDVPKLVSPDAFDEIVALAEAHKAGLAERFPGTDLVVIVIDTIGSAASFVDPNSQGETQRVMDMLRRVHQTTGALILLVDHHGKVAETGIMGSSAKAQSAEAVLAVLCDKNLEGNITNRRMALGKFRSGAGGAVTGFSLRPVPLTGFDGTTCVVDWSDDILVTVDRKAEKPAWRTAAEKTLKGCLERALIDHGTEKLPYGVEGSKVKAAPLARVRDAFMREYASDEDDPRKAKDAKRNAFKRARESAIAKGLVRTMQLGTDLVDWIWLVRDDAGADGLDR